VIDVSATYGSNYPDLGVSDGDAFLMEVVLTPGLLSVILGTRLAPRTWVSSARSAWAPTSLSPASGEARSGASMNPARTFGHDLVGGDFTSYWVYVAGPLIRTLLAVGTAWILRGPGGGRAHQAPHKETCSPRSSTPTRHEASRSRDFQPRDGPGL
jgi:aquaporin Z